MYFVVIKIIDIAHVTFDSNLKKIVVVAIGCRLLHMTRLRVKWHSLIPQGPETSSLFLEQRYAAQRIFHFLIV